MSSTTVRSPTGPLADVDLVALGAATGLMWRSPDITLVGLGPVERVELSLEGDARFAAVQERLTERAGPPAARAVDSELDELAGAGPVGFTTMSFSRTEPGVMLIPDVVIGESNGVRFTTWTDTYDLARVEVLVAEKLTEAPPSIPSSVSLTLDRTAESWRDDVVAVARDRIATSDLQKAVLARALTLTAPTDFPIGSIITSLAARFDQAMLFAIDGFIGASPELLVSRTNRTVRAHPLAGTAARSDDAAVDAQQIADLLASSKDRVEHQITIDWLLTELLAFCSYVDAEPEPSVLTLANVHHLGTLVEGVLSEPAASILDLVHAVHPTPALGGAPQADALALIDELEGLDRHRYGGPTGWVDAAGNGQFAVSVRTAQIDGPAARIVAGVGVVAQSDPQAELEETQAKFRAMLGTFLAL